MPLHGRPGRLGEARSVAILSGHDFRQVKAYTRDNDDQASLLSYRKGSPNWGAPGNGRHRPSSGGLRRVFSRNRLAHVVGQLAVMQGELQVQLAFCPIQRQLANQFAFGSEGLKSFQLRCKVGHGVPLTQLRNKKATVQTKGFRTTTETVPPSGPTSSLLGADQGRPRALEFCVPYRRLEAPPVRQVAGGFPPRSYLIDESAK